MNLTEFKIKVKKIRATTSKQKDVETKKYYWLPPHMLLIEGFVSTHQDMSNLGVNPQTP